MKKLPLLVLLAMLPQPGFVSAHEGEEHGNKTEMSGIHHME